MKVYILDVPSPSREQILGWLTEKPEITKLDVFTNSIQCIEKIETSPPDLCFVRLGITSIPGIKTAAMILAINPSIRIVFISSQSDYALDAYKLGAYGYLLCPVEKQKLDKILAKEAGN